MANQTQKNEFQIAGKLLEIHMPQRISDKFSRRTFILEVWTGNFSNPVIFECRNDRMKLLDDFKEKDWVVITYELTGRKYIREGDTAKFYVTLNCLNIING